MATTNYDITCPNHSIIGLITLLHSMTPMKLLHVHVHVHVHVCTTLCLRHGHFVQSAKGMVHI